MKTDQSIMRYLEMNDIFRMTLEAQVNEKFESLEDSIEQVSIQVKNTNLESHPIPHSHACLQRVRTVERL